MESRLDCVPCIARQALETARAFTTDEKIHELVLRETLRLCEKLDLTKPAPFTGQAVFRRLRELTGIKDPYLGEKRRQNAMAKRFLPLLTKKISSSDRKLETAARIAIAGNIIDLGAHVEKGEKALRDSLSSALTLPLKGKPEKFKKAVKGKCPILYIADNAGEIVLDRLLIERLGPERVTLAVRGGPVLNDALREDAAAAGLDKMVRIIDTGLDFAGINLKESSPEFRSAFLKAGIVIAKGQGNYETLYPAPEKVYFLFKAKCSVIAENAGVKKGDMVITNGKGESNDRR